MKLNEKILYYRKALKLSQEELAERIGVSRQAVSKWELGEATPEVEKLLLLARTFGVTTDELLSGESPESSDEGAQRPGEEPAPRGQPMDRTVGMIGRLVRRFGWLAGVYTALCGAGIALVGGIARYAFGAMFRKNQEVWNGFGSGFMVDGVYVVNGPGFGTVSSGNSAFDTMSQVPMAIATVILVIGLCVMAAGIVGAVVLYRKRGK